MTSKSKNMTRYHSAPFPACFRASTTTPAIDYHHAPPPSTTTTTPNLTTCLYQTHLGLFSLTWSRSLLARTLHLHPHPSSPTSPPPLTSPSFHLTLKPYIFWSKHGVKKLPYPNHPSLYILWDFTRAKFGPGPEPESGYYIAVVSASTTVLLVGDMDAEFRSTAKSKKLILVEGNQACGTATTGSNDNNRLNSAAATSSLVLRREHVCGNRFYTTKTNLGNKDRLIQIELNKSNEDDPRLTIKFDNRRVIQVKHLKWKFRGSERVEVDGHRVQLSWDVYNWLFDDEDWCSSNTNNGQDEGFALFTFRFEKPAGDQQLDQLMKRSSYSSERVVMWSQDSCGLSYERKKMKKKLLVKTRSGAASSSSLSTSSSGSSNTSVMEWESVEENQLKGPTGFSLLVYAWKS